MIPLEQGKWFVLAASSLGALLAAVMATAVNIMLPQLESIFNVEFALVQWVLLSFLLANITLLPILGRLADVLGRKQMFTVGYGVFTLGSLACALSSNIWMLVAMRVVQGIGAAIITALGFALITNTFPTHERGKAIGINGAVLSAGVVIGPTLGGSLLEMFTWRYVFMLGLPMGIIGTFLTVAVVPNDKPISGQRFDIAGALTLFVTLLSLSLAVTMGQQVGFTSALVLQLFVAAALAGTLFVRVELRSPHPAIDLRLFQNSELSVGLSAGLVVFVCISGAIFVAPFFLQNVVGYNAQQTGMLMSVVPIFLVVIAPIAGSLSDRYGARPITIAGLCSLLIGYTAIRTLTPDVTPLGYILRFLPIGIGMGTFQSPNNSAIMGAVPKAQAGVAGGLLVMTRTFGQTVGVAVLGSLWATRVLARAGTTTIAPTEASGIIQVDAMRDMLIINQALIVLALGLCCWDVWQRRQARRQAHNPKPVALN
jgi:EmrB/QacA subfamily drug resistance transporter